MKQDLQKVARVIIGGRPYLVFRDFSVEGTIREANFDKLLRRFILTDANGKKYVGCIVFYLELLTGYSWESEEDTMYGFGEMLEFSFANLLPYLNLDTANMSAVFQRSASCIIYTFTKNPQSIKADGINSPIEVKESFFATAQKMVFGETPSKKQIRREILQTLLNELEESPTTYMKIENLQSSIPITTKDLFFQLHLLKEEDKVEFITEPADTQKIISVKVKANGIRELETEVDEELKYPQMVKNVYGPNIENTTYGSNSPITVTIDEIETVFQALQKEIKESKEIKNKEEVTQDVKELEEELKKEKNPEKVKELLEKIKESGQWVYNKIISNPIVSGIIVELLMKGEGK